MNRQTFVIQVYAEGPSTLENLGTHERISVSDLAAVGPQLERWLAAPDGRDEYPAANVSVSEQRRETGAEHAEADQ